MTYIRSISDIDLYQILARVIRKEEDHILGLWIFKWIQGAMKRVELIF